MTGATERAALTLILRHDQLRQAAATLAAALALLAVIIASLSLGVVNLGLGTILRALASPILPARWVTDLSPVQGEIIRDLRLPRTLMAIVAGAGLSMSGVALQGLTRNVLVSPFTLGISPAAAFGAALAILLGVQNLTQGGPYLIVAAAFVSSLSCATFILGIASFRGLSPTMLILSGVGVTYLFSALTATIQFLGTEQQVVSIVHWTFGSLNGATWTEVTVAGGIFLVGAPFILGHMSALNAFAAGGDEVAASLGFAVVRTRLIITFAAVLITAGVVSFVGVIGFVGLVAPHIARLVIGGDHRSLLPYSAMVGALLLLIADLIGRLAFAPVIIPVGIVVAYIGVPIFLQLLLTRKQDRGE